MTACAATYASTTWAEIQYVIHVISSQSKPYYPALSYLHVVPTALHGGLLRLLVHLMQSISIIRATCISTKHMRDTTGLC